MIAESTAAGAGARPFYEFLESCLRHKVPCFCIYSPASQHAEMPPHKKASGEALLCALLANVMMGRKHFAAQAEMVIFEAARAIVGMPEVTQRELAPAVTVLQLFLTSSKPVLRFAAVRSLNKARALCAQPAQHPLWLLLPALPSVRPSCQHIFCRLARPESLLNGGLLSVLAAGSLSCL